MPARLSLFFAACLLASTALCGEGPPFRFTANQSVYIASATTRSRDISLTSANFGLERRLTDEFRKLKTFRVASSLKDADFVFLAVIDDQSPVLHELALAILPGDYRANLDNLDALRSVSAWQSPGQPSRRSKGAALTAASTGGASLLFYRPRSVCQDLVKQFHREVAH